MAERLAARPAARGVAGAGRLAGGENAGAGKRLLSYLLDSLFLLAFTLVFFTAAGLYIFLSSSSGRTNPSDEAFSLFAAILVATVPSWFILCAALLLLRRQTLGQYIAGLKVASEDGAPPGALRILAYLAALHPLIYHPLLASVWALIWYLSVADFRGDVVVLGSLAMAIVSLIAPLASLAFLLADPARRSIHDRLAGVKVVSFD